MGTNSNPAGPTGSGLLKSAPTGGGFFGAGAGTAGIYGSPGQSNQSISSSSSSSTNPGNPFTLAQTSPGATGVFGGAQPQQNWMANPPTADGAAAGAAQTLQQLQQQWEQFRQQYPNLPSLPQLPQQGGLPYTMNNPAPGRWDVYANGQQQQQTPLQSPVQAGYDAWDAGTHYGTAGQRVMYGGKTYESLGDMPNGQIGAGGGTWNENSRPDWTPNLWREVQAQQALAPVAAPAGPVQSYVGAPPERWQTGLKKGGLASLIRK